MWTRMCGVLLSCTEYYSGSGTHVALSTDTPMSQTPKSGGAYVKGQFSADGVFNIFGSDFQWAKQNSSTRRNNDASRTIEMVNGTMRAPANALGRRNKDGCRTRPRKRVCSKHNCVSKS